MAFSPDGRTAVSGSADRSIRLWRTGDGSLIRTLTGYTTSVVGVAFSPDGQTIASASAGRTVRPGGFGLFARHHPSQQVPLAG
ncbi:MAG: PD40 domain-containing protein [Chloroflexi bacterium]|nr:PD40 domain-containing protein [Chloroflexota bacterium]